MKRLKIGPGMRIQKESDTHMKTRNMKEFTLKT